MKRKLFDIAARLGSLAVLIFAAAGCGQTPERLLGRDIAIGYDRGSVVLRQGQTVSLTLNLTCAASTATSPFQVEVGLSHQVEPASSTLAIDPAILSDVACETPTSNGLFAGRVEVRLHADASASPGPQRLSTRATISAPVGPGDQDTTTVDVLVIAANAPLASNVSATGAPAAVTLAWTTDPSDPHPATSHRIERRGPTGDYFALATVPASTSGYIDTGLQPDADYAYRLVPINADGEGPPTPVSARTLVSTSPRLFALTLTVDGSAAGRVVSQPAGLDCPGTCRAEFAEGTNVSLVATPPANGVVSWSGSAACSGSGQIVQVPLSGPTSCRATFSATPPTVPPGWTSAGSVRTVPGLLGAPAVAFDTNGEPTVAYVEQGTSTDRGALRVVRRRGGLWLLVSVDPVNANAPAATGSPGLVLLANGEPVVAWTNETGEMRVSAWNGTAWSPFGNGNLAFGGRTTPASAPQLDRLGDRLVAAWTEGTTSGARIVVARWDLAAASTQPVSTSVVPGAGSSGGLVARLALDRGGNASLLLLRTGITGAELPLRLLRESLGWQTACPDLGSGGGLANTSIGFDVQHDRLRDDSAVVLRPSADYRQVLGARCVNGSWQPLGLSANGVVAEVDNIGRTLRRLALIPERGGRGPVALVAIDDGYRASTSYVQALLGDAGFEVAPGLERARIARGGTLGAAALGAGAIGLVQGFELGSAIEIEVWRFAP